MSEYIDREKIIEMCKRMISEKWNSKIAPVSWSCAYADFIDYVEDIPAEDVAPVVHGTPMLRCRPERYERYEECGMNENGETLYLKRVMVDEESYAMYCPACGKRLCSRFTSFCPNCGAKMDGLEDK